MRNGTAYAEGTIGNVKGTRDNLPAPPNFRARSVALMALALLVALSVSRAPIFSPDSARYLDISKTCAKEHRIATYYLNLNSTQIPDPAMLWPPVYPCLLAIPQAAGMGALWAVRLVIILSILTIALTVRTLCSAIDPSAPATLCGVLILLWIVNARIFTCAWSEAPFTAFVMLFLVCGAKHIRDGRLSWLALAGIAGALAFLTRYIGLVLLPVGAIVVLQRRCIEHRRENPAAWRRMLVFGAPFAAVSCPWLLRNALLVGRPFGPARPPSSTSALDNLRLVGDTLLADIPLVLGLLVVGAVGLFLTHRVSRSRIAHSRTAHACATIGTYVAAYVALQVLLSTTSCVDPIGTRLLNPLYVPLIVLTACTLQRLASRTTVAILRPAYAVGGAILVLAILYRVAPLSASGWRSLFDRPIGGGMTKIDEWILANTEENALIVGNNVWGTRFKTGRPVLESGYPSEPPLTEEGIHEFLDRFADRIPAAYLLCRSSDPLDQNMEDHPVVFSDGNGGRVRRLSVTSESGDRRTGAPAAATLFQRQAPP